MERSADPGDDSSWKTKIKPNNENAIILPKIKIETSSRDVYEQGILQIQRVYDIYVCINKCKMHY